MAFTHTDIQRASFVVRSLALRTVLLVTTLTRDYMNNLGFHIVTSELFLGLFQSVETLGQFLRVRANIGDTITKMTPFARALTLGAPATTGINTPTIVLVDTTRL